MYPFKQSQKGDTIIREFSPDVDSEELVWHRDRSDRYVKVLEGSGWYLQVDNQIPQKLIEGSVYFIPANNYHRVIRGKDSLVVSIKENKMKVTRSRLRQIIKEAMLNEYGMGSEYDHLRSKPDLSGFEDPTDLEATVYDLLSAEGERLFEQAFGRGSYKKVYLDFDADGIYNGGRNIIAALERMGLEQSIPSVYEYVFQQWAKKYTDRGIFTDLSYDDYHSQGR